MKTYNLRNMSKARRDKLYAESEKVTYADTRPLNAEERAFFKRAARRGRPRIGKGSERINVTIERTLLKRIDAYAKTHGITRAALLAHGARRIVAA